MSFPANGTKLTNLVNPQVMADLIDKKLVDLMRFAPLAKIDTTLVGRPGNTISLPSYAYIGDAATVNEGADISISQLTESAVTATIHKIAKGVQIPDEAALSGYGDPIGQATYQIALSIASQLDNEVFAVLNAITGTMLYTGGATFSADDVNSALIKFGEDVDGEKVLIVNPADYAVLRKSSSWVPASEMSAGITISGTVGEIYGCQVVISNKLTTPNTAYIVKPGALAIYLKRDTLVETDRDIINKSTVITADKHEVCYLFDASKAIKLVKNP